MRFRAVRSILMLVLVSATVVACGAPQPDAAQAEQPALLVDEYLERHFTTFPTRATEAGRYDLDEQLEDLDAESRERWLEYNRQVVDRSEELLAGELDLEDRFDLELLVLQARRQVFEFGTVRWPERDPLFWTGIVGNATVFLLVREGRPKDDRLRAAVARAEALPDLLVQARSALDGSDPAAIPPELCAIAARQAEGSAEFFREGLAGAAAGATDPAIAEEARRAGRQAAEALDEFAAFLGALESQAAGSPRLDEDYAEAFRLGTGVDAPLDEVLAGAEAALLAKRAEAAEFGRSIWNDYFVGENAPTDDRDLVRRLFARVAEDRATTTEAFHGQYRELIDRSIRLVREQDVVTLPDPLTLYVGGSPSFFVGQSVGGVYPAGPYDPEADTLLFLPTPPDDALPEARAAFYRDFNDHFNRMITPHEIIPGHYLQLKFAARHPRKVRAMFGDGVYIEGWGTFCERLMLDLGWGDPLDRLAHLKKQLENIARTIVDIRVHTREMSRDEVLRFVEEEALQDRQFASNMWTRSITSAPQLTTYFLGYEQVFGLYEDVRESRGEAFVLREFMDGMMELGPVPVRRYRERMLPSID